MALVRSFWLRAGVVWEILIGVRWADSFIRVGELPGYRPRASGADGPIVDVNAISLLSV